MLVTPCILVTASWLSMLQSFPHISPTQRTDELLVKKSVFRNRLVFIVVLLQIIAIKIPTAQLLNKKHVADSGASHVYLVTRGSSGSVKLSSKKRFQRFLEKLKENLASGKCQGREDIWRGLCMISTTTTSTLRTTTTACGTSCRTRARKFMKSELEDFPHVFLQFKGVSFVKVSREIFRHARAGWHHHAVDQRV